LPNLPSIGLEIVNATNSGIVQSSNNLNNVIDQSIITAAGLLPNISSSDPLTGASQVIQNAINNIEIAVNGIQNAGNNSANIIQGILQGAASTSNQTGGIIQNANNQINQAGNSFINGVQQSIAQLNLSALQPFLPPVG